MGKMYGERGPVSSLWREWWSNWLGQKRKLHQWKRKQRSYPITVVVTWCVLERISLFCLHKNVLKRIMKTFPFQLQSFSFYLYPHSINRRTQTIYTETQETQKDTYTQRHTPTHKQHMHAHTHTQILVV